jgi:hypothetical protein
MLDIRFRLLIVRIGFPLALFFSTILAFSFLLASNCTQIPNKWACLRIESNPPGALVADQFGSITGHTPCDGLFYVTIAGSLPGNNLLSNKLTISKSGYKLATIAIKYEYYKYRDKFEAIRNPQKIFIELQPEIDSLSTDSIKPNSQ